MTGWLVCWAALCVGGSAGTWEVTPRFQIGQELIYEGRIKEIESFDGAQSEAERRLHVRALVLAKSAKGTTTLGCYTIHKSTDSPKISKPGELESALDVHFDKVTVAPNGHAVWAENGAEIAPWTESLAVAELGYFLEGPGQPVEVGNKWVVKRDGQPPLKCECGGTEVALGNRCVVIHFEQESQNWAKEDITLSAWKITGKMLYDLKTETVYRVERTLETRDPAAPLATRIRKVWYEQSSNMKYHGSILEHQTEDFEAAYKAQKELDQALAYEDSTRERMLNAVRQELKLVMQKLYSTPYRPAIERMHDLAESAMKVAAENERVPATVLGRRKEAVLGQKAPHFVFKSAKDGEKISKKSIKGESVLAVFVDPESELSREALRTALAAVGDHKPADLRILAVMRRADGETEAVLKRDVPGNYEVCSGSSADGIYGIQGTPHVVFIDNEGILRMNQKGFGPEMRGALAENLGKLPTANIATKKSKEPSGLR